MFLQLLYASILHVPIFQLYPNQSQGVGTSRRRGGLFPFQLPFCGVSKHVTAEYFFYFGSTMICNYMIQWGLFPSARTIQKRNASKQKISHIYIIFREIREISRDFAVLPVLRHWAKPPAQAETVPWPPAVTSSPCPAAGCRLADDAATARRGGRGGPCGAVADGAGDAAASRGGRWALWFSRKEMG